MLITGRGDRLCPVRYAEELCGKWRGKPGIADLQECVAEMERRFEERLTQLREAAEVHEESALDAAFDRLLGSEDPGRT